MKMLKAHNTQAKKFVAAMVVAAGAFGLTVGTAAPASAVPYKDGVYQNKPVYGKPGCLDTAVFKFKRLNRNGVVINQYQCTYRNSLGGVFKAWIGPELPDPYSGYNWHLV